MSSLENSPEKIHYQVTRPRVDVVDVDGKGSYSISPLGFPNVDVSGETDSNPTLFNPKFSVSYEQQESYSLAYTENTNNIDDLYGLVTFTIGISSITWAGGIATVTTSTNHGLVNGKSITIIGVEPDEFNTSQNVVLTWISATQFSYPLASDPGTYSSGGTVRYTSSNGDYVKLTTQTNITENETYIVKLKHWQKIARPVKSNTTENMNLFGYEPITHYIEDIEGDGYIATANTQEPHGLHPGNYIIINGASPYDGSYYILTRENEDGDINNIKSGTEFLFENTNTILVNSGTAVYTPEEDDLIKVTSQYIESENGLYIASSGDWDFYGTCYSYDGTENDNVEGTYGSNYVDADGNPVTHYRKGYSHEEVATYLREKLDTSIEFGRFRGSLRNDHGAMIKWLQGGRKVNIGGDGAGKEVFVDPFGYGNPPDQLERTEGVINSYDAAAVATKRTEVDRLGKYTKWGLSNIKRKILAEIYDSGDVETRDINIYDIHDAGSIDDESRGNFDDISDGGNVSMRNYDIGKAPHVKDWPFTYNTESESIILNGGTSADLGIDDWRISLDGTSTNYIRPLATNVDYYMQDNSYHNNITLDLNNPEIFGRQHVSIAHNLDISDMDSYGTEAAYALDDVAGVSFSTGIHILKKVVSSNLTKYYFKQRKKSTITDIIPVGTGWAVDVLTYEASGANGIKIYLEETETDYIIFTNANKTTAELLIDLKANNDLIPDVFNPTTVEVSTLNELFVDNSDVDYSDAVNQDEKIRSKKTFIHLPAPLEMPDGQTFELDVSLPVDPYSDVFPFNTVGSLSGYRNFVTQPRAYVLGGYQKCSATDITYSSLTRSGNTAVFVSESAHGIYSSTFLSTAVTPASDSIAVSDVTQFSIGYTVRFANAAGVLPGGIVAGTDYTISEIDEDRIKLSGVTITSAGSGTNTIVICNDVRILVRGADQDDYNGEFDATVTDVDELQYAVENSPTSPATGNPEIDKLVYVDGNDGVKGLTERSNSQIFGAMPEMEFAEDGSIYHQPPITTDDLIGNGDTDKRVLLACVYPTSTNTFQWRLDNDPQLRMLQWSLLSLSGSTGSASHVAYNRNKLVIDEFTPEYTATMNELDAEEEQTLTSTVETTLKEGDNIVVTGIIADGIDVDEIGVYSVGDVYRVIFKESNSVFTIETGTLSSSGATSLVFKFKHLMFDFSMEESPLRYNSTIFHSETENTNKVSHLLNSYIRVKLPEKLIPSDSDDATEFDSTYALTDDEIAGIGSYVYQASKGYNSLISDFYKGRVLFHGEFKYEYLSDGLNVETRSGMEVDDGGDVETRTVDDDFISDGGDVVSRIFRRDEETFQTDATNFLMGYDGNNTSTQIPATFYDQTAGQKFIEYNTTSLPDQDSRNGYRWITKGIFTPDYVVNTQEFSNRIIEDSYLDVDPDLKTYLSSYFVTDKERETNAGNRFIQGDLNPSVDPSFEFSVGTESILIDHLLATDAKPTVIDDVRRKIWGSKFEIPWEIDRKFTNRIHIQGQDIENLYGITGFTAFYGFYGVPFGKIFSTDRFAPSENSVTGIENYATIRASSTYDVVESTLQNALESNPISHRLFKTENYLEAFASINAIDDDDEELQEYLRNYVSGYSNRMPMRFYNSFRIAVYGKTTSTEHNADFTDIERIYLYSVNDYLTEFGDVPGAFVGTYIDDNFIFQDDEIEEDEIFVEDYNETWMFFDDATTDASVIKDMISVSGMPYIADNVFYKQTMKKNYTRVKMKFIFSRKAGRWFVTDYRQFPTSYLTPTFGNEALSHREKSIVYAGKKGNELNDYVPIVQPKPDFVENVVELNADRTELTISMDNNMVGSVEEYNLAITNGEDFIIYVPEDENSVKSAQLFTKYITGTVSSMVQTEQEDESDEIFYIVTLSNTSVPTDFGSIMRISTARDTIAHGIYPYNAAGEETETDFLWKNADYVDRNEIYKKLNTTPYHKLNPMRLNRFTYPFFTEDEPISIIGASVDYYDLITITTSTPHGYLVGNDLNISVQNVVEGEDVSYTEKIAIYSVPSPTTFTYKITAPREFPRSSISKITYLEDYGLSAVYIQASDVDSFNEEGYIKIENTDYHDGTYKVVTNHPFTTTGIVVIESPAGAVTEDPAPTSAIAKKTVMQDITSIIKSPYYNTSKVNMTTLSFDALEDSEYINITGTEFHDGVYKANTESNYFIVPSNSSMSSEDPPPSGSVITESVFPALEGSSSTLTGTATRLNFPYDNNGDRLEILDPERDISEAETYGFDRLLDPVENINFIVPNNVFGGAQNPNKDNLKVFNPHMWKVFWHMRPAVCSMFNTDIPSKTSRNSGSMADPVLNSMFLYPDINNATYHIPWHLNMEMDWLTNEWFQFYMLDAKIDNHVENIERDEYDWYDADIDNAIRNRERNCYILMDALRW